jgi:hypothetical protein
VGNNAGVQVTTEMREDATMLIVIVMQLQCQLVRCAVDASLEKYESSE